jgi:hypothetical protein
MPATLATIEVNAVHAQPARAQEPALRPPARTVWGARTQPPEPRRHALVPRVGPASMPSMRMRGRVVLSPL